MFFIQNSLQQKVVARVKELTYPYPSFSRKALIWGVKWGTGGPWITRIQLARFRFNTVCKLCSFAQIPRFNTKTLWVQEVKKFVCKQSKHYQILYPRTILKMALMYITHIVDLSFEWESSISASCTEINKKLNTEISQLQEAEMEESHSRKRSMMCVMYFSLNFLKIFHHKYLVTIWFWLTNILIS